MRMSQAHVKLKGVNEVYLVGLSEYLIALLCENALLKMWPSFLQNGEFAPK